MSNAVVLIVLTLAVLVVVTLPLVRRGRAGRARPPASGTPTPAIDLPDESPAAAALREIELDHAMGRLSDDDYAALRSRYERELEASPGARAPAPPPQAPRRPAAPPAGGDLDARAEALVARYRGHAPACPSCGVRPEPDATFCSSCGRRLLPCPACGAAITEPDARFCPSCGTPLAA